MKYDIAILGGGISGLSCAFFLQKFAPSLSCILIEPRPQLGGWIQSVVLPSGQHYEAGPRCLRLRGKSGCATVDLLEGIGLLDEIIKAAPSANSRYVVLDGKPCALPEGLATTFTSPIGRHLAYVACKEPFRKKGANDDESVASFFSRRCHSPLVNQLADALVTGIWGGKADELSIYQTLPELKNFEEQWGSCLIGGIASIFKKRERPKISGICTLKQGLHQIIEALLNNVHLPIYTATSVDAIDTSSPITVSTSIGKIQAEKIICALPEPSLYQLIPASTFSVTSRPFPHASFTTAVMGWRNDCLAKKGFGILAPSTEDPHVLGIVMDSAVFPQHNTPMNTRLTVIMGGARWPECTQETDDSLLSLAYDRVKRWTGIEEPCDEYAILRARNAIPQPPVNSGHPVPYFSSPCQRIFAINSSVGGVSINNCVYSARELAKSF